MNYGGEIMQRVLIIGGGPSGFAAAISAKKPYNQVQILERNSTPLKKLLMTGNGKCNYLHDSYKKEDYHSEKSEKIEEIICEENIKKVEDFFDDLGIVPKIKNGNYYPFSMQATTIKKVLEKKAKDCGVEVLCHSLVTKIEKKEDGFLVTCNEEVLECDILILATGSYAYPKTGSDGMGYHFLESFGHSLVKPLPALVQLIGRGTYFKEWDGIRSEVALELFEDDLKIADEEGEIQLTNYGISGICVFNLSHFVTRGLDVRKKEVIKINFVPFEKEDFPSWLPSYCKKHPTKNLEEVLSSFLNSKLANVILQQSNLKRDTFYSELSPNEQNLLCQNLLTFPVEIIGTKDFNSCQICNGGVDLDDISSSTMESKKVKNLYIVGELLDLNGNCGGFNLTTCWLSGILAGEGILKNDSN